MAKPITPIKVKFIEYFEVIGYTIRRGIKSKKDIEVGRKIWESDYLLWQGITREMDVNEVSFRAEWVVTRDGDWIKMVDCDGARTMLFVRV
jgi:hypothetical protein